MLAGLCDSVSLPTGGRNKKIKHPNAHKLRAMSKGMLKNPRREEESLVLQHLKCGLLSFMKKQVKPVTRKSA